MSLSASFCVVNTAKVKQFIDQGVISRMLIICGPPGSGKNSLITAYANDNNRRIFIFKDTK